MPRPAGESDKLGNLYEGLWTIAKLLNMATGKVRSLTVEPIGPESLGIEFIATRADGTREAHSVKRQRAAGEWSLAALAQKDPKTGRSILGDFLAKLLASRDLAAR